MRDLRLLGSSFASALLCVLVLAGLTSCDLQPTTDQQQAAQTERAVAEASRQVGMPAIVNFTERKFAKMILELRDTEVSTFTYIVDMHGELHFLTESIGYGIPYSVQFTNPERKVTGHRGNVTLPQPDPNGLFMPTSSSATWVLAVGGDGEVKPIYVEPTIVVSPLKLHG